MSIAILLNIINPPKINSAKSINNRINIAKKHVRHNLVIIFRKTKKLLILYLTCFFLSTRISKKVSSLNHIIFTKYIHHNGALFKIIYYYLFSAPPPIFKIPFYSVIFEFFYMNLLKLIRFEPFHRFHFFKIYIIFRFHILIVHFLFYQAFSKYMFLQQPQRFANHKILCNVCLNLS